MEEQELPKRRKNRSGQMHIPSQVDREIDRLIDAIDDLLKNSRGLITPEVRRKKFRRLLLFKRMCEEERDRQRKAQRKEEIEAHRKAERIRAGEFGVYNETILYINQLANISITEIPFSEDELLSHYTPFGWFLHEIVVMSHELWRNNQAELSLASLLIHAEEIDKLLKTPQMELHGLIALRSYQMASLLSLQGQETRSDLYVKLMWKHIDLVGKTAKLLATSRGNYSTFYTAILWVWISSRGLDSARRKIKKALASFDFTKLFEGSIASRLAYAFPLYLNYVAESQLAQEFQVRINRLMEIYKFSVLLKMSTFEEIAPLIDFLEDVEPISALRLIRTVLGLRNEAQGLAPPEFFQRLVAKEIILSRAL